MGSAWSRIFLKVLSQQWEDSLNFTGKLLSSVQNNKNKLESKSQDLKQTKSQKKDKSKST